MKSLLCILLATVAVASSCKADCCPQYWHQFQGYCYRYFGDRVTWAAAEERCNQHFTSNGMAHLISVHSDSENRFAYELFRSSAGDTPYWSYISGGPNHVYGYWIGLHQETSGGQWVNTDDSAFDYNNWKYGEPNNDFYGTADEDCVHVWRRYYADDTNRVWNDMPCQKSMAFICKVKT
ncbi:alpha-N-acetylgalactosamine-specific lectin-like [Diadema antillarum]|uniref:alpha-N-acetylgalactosamine-specific lectin-like n=1 Tax=Diadema antillarum TaxID=105358 RepID=UPI003A86352B